METWKIIASVAASIAGGISGAVAIVVLLGKRLVDQWMQRELETHKAQLNRDSSVALERLKVELQNVANEKSVVFSRLHDKRADVVAELYKKIVDSEAKLRAFVNPLSGADWQGEKEEVGAEAIKRLKEWEWFFYRHRIFFSEQTCKKLDTLVKTFSEVNIKLWVKFSRNSSDDDILDEWEKADRVARETLPLIKQEVEQEFRSLLGVVELEQGQMKYTTTDRADARIIEGSPAPLPFPGRVEALPEAVGVVILTDDIDEVLFVGWDTSIRAVAERAAHNAAAALASRLRWFRTADEKAARALGKAMIRRYKPKGNEDDSQWGVAPV